MKKILTISLLTASILISGCLESNDNTSAKTTPDINIVCASQTMPNQIHNAMEQIINSSHQRFSSQDIRQWMDSDKLLALSSKLTVSISQPQLNQGVCETQVSITIPESVLKLASTNAPLLQLPTPIESIKQHIQDYPIQLNGDTLTFPLEYTSQYNSSLGFTTHNNNLSNASQILADTLLPYGIRDIIFVHGQNITRQEALKLLQHPNTLSATTASVANTPNQPPIDTQQTASMPTPEVLSPELPANKIAPQEVLKAQQDNQIARQNIRATWQNISPEIQKDLITEQQNWETQKQQNCHRVAEQSNDPTEQQYLKIQCDTRLTRERIQYLKGFSIE